MRTLKKTLCLVLALAMILGLGAFSVSAASVVDDADVGADYREAIDVLTETGILTGDDKNQINPQEELRRIEGAIIIARLNGVTQMAGPAPYNDVTSDWEWGGNAIADCTYRGIIVGDGNGNFMPGEPLTAYAFEKMLLVALGYDAQIEKMANAGDTWTIATAALAKKAGINWPSLNPASPLTREQAAKLALNALKADTVEYGDKGVTVNTSDGTQVLVGAKAATAVQVDVANTWANAIKNDAVAGKYTVQLGEDLFNGDLKQVDNNTTDSFGHPAAKWTYKNKDITTAAKSPVAWFAGSTSATNVANALRGYSFKVPTITSYETLAVSTTNPSSQKMTNAVVYENGNVVTAAIAITAKTNPAAVIADLTKNGNLVEVYVDDDNLIKSVVVTTYTVGKISNITTSSGGNVTYTIEGAGSKTVYNDGSSNYSSAKAYGTFAKNDYVTYVEDNGATNNGTKMTHIYPTTTFVGQQSSISGTKIVVNGETYTIGDGVKKAYDNKDEFPNTDKDYTYYVDQYGFVVKTEAIESSKSYAVIEAISYSGGSGINSTDKVQVKLAYADGTTSGTLTVDTIKIGKENTAGKMVYTDYKISNNKIKGIDKAPAAVGKYDGQVVTLVKGDNSVANGDKLAYNSFFHGQIVTYAVKSNGNLELTLVNLEDGKNAGGTKGVNLTNAGMVASSTDGTDVTVKNSPSVNIGANKVGTNTSTVFLIGEKNGSENEYTYHAYTGYTAVPSIKSKGGDVYVYASQDNKADFVYVDAYAVTVTGSTDLLYVPSGNKFTQTGSGSSAVYTLTGILNGEADKTVTIDTESLAQQLSGSGALWSVTYNNSGKISSASKLGLDKFSSNASNGVIGILKNGVGVSYAYNDSSKIIVIDKDGKIVEGADVTVVDKDHDAGYVKTKGSSGADEYTIDTLYVFQEAYTVDSAENNPLTSGDETNDLQARVANADGTYVYDNSKASTPLTLGELEIASGKGLEIVGNVAVTNGETITVKGDMTIDGDLSSSDGTGEVLVDGGTLTINSDSATLEISAHVEVTGGGTVILNGKNATDEFTVANDSLIVKNGKVFVNGDLKVTGTVAVYGNLLNGDYTIDGDVQEITVDDTTYSFGGNRLVVKGKITGTGKLYVYTVDGDADVTGASITSGNAVFANSNTSLMSGVTVVINGGYVDPNGKVTAAVSRIGGSSKANQIG